MAGTRALDTGLLNAKRMSWLLLAGMLLTYMLLTQVVKAWFHRRYEE